MYDTRNKSKMRLEIGKVDISDKEKKTYTGTKRKGMYWGYRQSMKYGTVVRRRCLSPSVWHTEPVVTVGENPLTRCMAITIYLSWVYPHIFL